MADKEDILIYAIKQRHLVAVEQTFKTVYCTFLKW